MTPPSSTSDVAYLPCLAAQEAAYWEARRQGMNLNDKQIGDLLRVAAPELQRYWLSREDFARICEEVYEEDTRNVIADGASGSRTGYEQDAAILDRIRAHLGATTERAPEPE